ncbi:methyltransferase domain-containing protein [Diaphorobacter sp. HDW4A]|uniref:class I SAM-dependent methyltransferase n=1 Tax=Diaphorobacter sp. HDW4A TaxID=2714924 RepID=UPI001408A620|nr:methyltransferase domain-containing protein [Diaphorobacter sp. HDW4A]QIL79723.1 methyltransferase domain-containing protein [Diaphorobacter sp. HDW4A]
MSTYLPELSISDLVHALESRDWSVIDERLGEQQFERLGLDRALRIASDLALRHGSLRGLRVLDVGCNNGLVAKTLAALGCNVVGIDNGDVDNQGLYSDLHSQTQRAGFEFHRKDLSDFLASDDRYWDCILLLSVTHHWESGYAMSGERRYSDDDIRNLLATLFARTRASIYYECPAKEPGFEAGFGVNFLLRYCSELPKMRTLGHTIGPNGYPREFWALDME